MKVLNCVQALRLKGLGLSFRVGGSDVGFGDNIYPEPETFNIPLILNLMPARNPEPQSPLASDPK